MFAPWCCVVFPSSSSLNGHPGRLVTRQARGGRRGPPGGAWAGPGAHCGVGPAWVLGLFGAQTPRRAARWSAKRHSSLSSPQVAKAPHRALLSAQPRPAAGRATPRVARAAVRPAAPVRLGRGGGPPGLISPNGVLPCSRARPAPAPGSMLDPHDDTDEIGRAHV